MAKLNTNSYGKSRIRLMKVSREEKAQTVKDWTVQVLLQGDFETCFTDGDNSRILPTDTMKNTVYSLARSSSAGSIEEFGNELATFLLDGNPQVTVVQIDITEKRWDRVDDSTFRQTGPEIFTAKVERSHGTPISINSGVEGLVILKTSKSGFSGYIKDALTTLPETRDRLFGTEATLRWSYSSNNLPFESLRIAILETFLNSFAEHDSLSVQHTLFATAKAVLDAHEAVEEIEIVMPNRHCLLVNLAPFGQDNPNEIFVPTEEPHGTIRAKVSR